MSESPSALKQRISDLMKSCMKSGDKEQLAFVRNLHAAIRKREIDDRKDLDDAEIQKIASTSIKQRQDSIDQFRKGGREDLVAKEEAELKFLQSFLPAQLSDDELKSIIQGAVAEAQATTAKDIGKVMKVLMPKVQGKADGKKINEFVKAQLGS